MNNKFKKIYRIIEKQFFDINHCENELWRIIFNNLLVTYKWTDREKLIRMRYIEHKSVTNICMDIPISNRTYSNWRKEILNRAYDWAKEFKIM